MSWSFSAIGKPNDVVAALEKYGKSLAGQSLVEFDDALPCLVVLVKQNFVDGPQPGYLPPLVRVEACGSGSARDVGQGLPTQLCRSCSVKIEPFYGNLV